MPASNPDSQPRVVVWRNLVANGTEYCSLWHVPEGWVIEGTAIAVLQDRGPLLVRYEVHGDEQWRTHRVSVERSLRDDHRTLELRVEGRGGWREAGRERPELRPCVDIDLGITPSTNLLPIRRLKLEVGKSAEIVAAWIKFPELTVQPLRQRYTRLAADRYLYESGTNFKAEISVDDAGLPIQYQGVWERVTA